MATRVRTVRDVAEYSAALAAIGHYFGWAPTEEDSSRFARLLPFDRLHAVLDEGRIVAGAGAFPFRLTVPGGQVACAGVTVVGVLPSHRRRGLLRRMMDTQLEDVRERGEPIASLWASEETIYGRFGYGLASTGLHVDAERHAVSISRELPRSGTVRLVDDDEATRLFPRIYRRVSRGRPGMIVRTKDWWTTRRLDDRPEQRRGAGPLARALLERDGQPVGYALYRLSQEGSTPETWKKTVRVNEAFGVDAPGTWEMWRFLFEIDWVDRIAAAHLPLDHPLPFLVDRMNKLRLSIWDALWVRLVDVPAALAARTYATPGGVTIEVASDPHFGDNVGTWTVERGEVRRTGRRPDVRVAVDGLGSVYLGGLSFSQLARAGRAEEVARGGVARADAVFRTDAAPWCPENF